MDRSDKEKVILSLLGLFPNYMQCFHLMNVRQYDLTETQFNIILSLDITPKMTMSELAEKVCVSRELASRAVAPLVDRDLIERSHNQQNRRQINMNLTCHGKEYLSQIQQGYTCCMLSHLDRLSDEELEQFMTSLNTIEGILGKLTEK